VNEHRVWPLPYSRLPAVLNSAALVLLTLTVLVAVSCAKPYFLVFLLTGIAMSLVASGRRVVIRDGCVVLEYGFPKPVLRYVVRDVTEVFDINELSRGRLVKYFKTLLVPFILIMILPLVYVVARGAYPNPAYVPLMVIPIIMGAFLTIYMMFTSPSYRKFLRRAAAVTATVSTSIMAFMVGYFYRDVYGRSIFSNPADAVMGITFIVLLVLATSLFAILGGRNHVVILVDAEGRYYAVGTAGAEAARGFISMVLNAVREGREGPEGSGDA